MRNNNSYTTRVKFNMLARIARRMGATEIIKSDDNKHIEVWYNDSDIYETCIYCEEYTKAEFIKIILSGYYRTIKFYIKTRLHREELPF